MPGAAGSGRLRAALRHEQQTVALALSGSRHHSAQVRADQSFVALRSHKTDRTVGKRPGVLQDPVPQLVVEHTACPRSGAPLLAVPPSTTPPLSGFWRSPCLSARKRRNEEKKG